MTPILFCNIAWMKTYTGDPTDEPIGGGSHPVKEEKNNFNPFDGQMFGYVPTGGSETINIARLGAVEGTGSVDGVNVVWTATRPDQGGRVVIGWYKDATVFRKLRKHPNGRYYHFKAAQAICHLLEPSERDLPVKTAQQVEGGAGRSVWYGESPYGLKLKNRVKAFIDQEFDRDQLELKAGRLVDNLDVPPKGSKRPLRTKKETEVWGRNKEVHAYALQRANGTCQLCGKPAPFKKKRDNRPFLEVHHVKRLAKGGADVPSNTVALCPNCHRAAHYGAQRTIQKKLRRVLTQLETSCGLGDG